LTLRSEAGYIDARPLIASSTKSSCNARPDHTDLSSGEEAATLLTSGMFKVRALVADVKLMSKMNGWELFQRAREVGADVPVKRRDGRMRRPGCAPECSSGKAVRSGATGDPVA